MSKNTNLTSNKKIYISNKQDYLNLLSMNKQPNSNNNYESDISEALQILDHIKGMKGGGCGDTDGNNTIGSCGGNSYE